MKARLTKVLPLLSQTSTWHKQIYIMFLPFSSIFQDFSLAWSPETLHLPTPPGFFEISNVPRLFVSIDLPTSLRPAAPRAPAQPWSSARRPPRRLRRWRPPRRPGGAFQGPKLANETWRKAKDCNSPWLLTQKEAEVGNMKTLWRILGRSFGKRCQSVKVLKSANAPHTGLSEAKGKLQVFQGSFLIRQLQRTLSHSQMKHSLKLAQCMIDDPWAFPWIEGIIKRQCEKGSPWSLA